MVKILVEVRSNYGTEMIYPVGEAAQYVQNLTGKKTINQSDIAALRALGLTVERQQVEALAI